MIFVSFVKSPKFMELWWIDVGPWIHAFFCISDFLLIPIIVVIQNLSNREAIGFSIFTEALWLCTFTNLVKMFILFPINVLPIFLGGLNKVLDLKKRRELTRGYDSFDAYYKKNQETKVRFDAEVKEEL